VNEPVSILIDLRYHCRETTWSGTSARQVLLIWQSSNTALTPVSVLQTFGYSGNTDLNVKYFS